MCKVSEKNELILDRTKRQIREEKKHGKGQLVINMPKRTFDQMMEEARACGRENEIKFPRNRRHKVWDKQPMILGAYLYVPGRIKTFAELEAEGD